eukprot:6649239-Pyramimonas_sp.AAC.1
MGPAGALLALAGHTLRMCGRPQWALWVPSATSIGIAFIVAPEQSLNIFAGASFLARVFDKG